MLLQWGRDTEEIVKQIKSRQSFLKIILKTFNDSFFLEKWIKHHANIVGLENLVIADNMSTDEDVLAVYEKYMDITVFQFSSSHHNHIHDRKIFASLYEAFSLSCQYTLFIDTDEFLVWLDDDCWYADNSVIDRLKLISAKGAIPATWIHNAPHSDSIFHIGLNKNRILSEMKWGKPFVPSQFANAGILIHNEQFPKSSFWEKPGITNFLLLHFTKLSTEQRIKVNKNKLIKRGFCLEHDSIDFILNRDCSNSKDRTIIRLVNEIRDCITNQYNTQEYRHIPNGCLKLVSTGKIEYASSIEKSNLENFINYPELNIRLALNLPTGNVMKIEESIEEFIAKSIAFRDTGDILAAKIAFNKGMKEHPLYLDQYGHPVFKKELIRTLLIQQQWDEAISLIPKQGDLGGEHWHEILFARAYSNVNDIENAKLWWSRIIERNPDSQEAKAFFISLDTTLSPSNDNIRIWKPGDISLRPHMEKAGVALMELHLKKAKTFLEYGAGGSTVFAAELGLKNIHSVESDKSFLDAVQQKVALLYPSAKVNAHFVNIGKTREWGQPVDKERADLWPKYCISPWQKIVDNNEFPNVILIDGRFRVACFLASLLLAKEGTVILFDDYIDRPHYHIVEKYLKPNKTAGRMAEFITTQKFSVSSLLLDLISNSANPA